MIFLSYLKLNLNKLIDTVKTNIFLFTVSLIRSFICLCLTLNSIRYERTTIQGVTNVLINVSNEMKKMPDNTLIFILMIFNNTMSFLINDSTEICYDEVKLIIHDYIEISYNEYLNNNQSNIYSSPFINNMQLEPISCILTRLYCDYLHNIKSKQKDMEKRQD